MYVSLTGHEAEREVENLEDAIGWPEFPWLRVQRDHDRSTQVDLALIHAYDIGAVAEGDEGAEIRVFNTQLARLDEFATDDQHGRRVLDIDDLPVLEAYPSAQAVVEGGWRRLRPDVRPEMPRDQDPSSGLMSPDEVPGGWFAGEQGGTRPVDPADRKVAKKRDVVLNGLDELEQALIGAGRMMEAEMVNRMLVDAAAVAAVPGE